MVTDCSKQDAGFYTCCALNVTGRDVCSAELMSEGANDIDTTSYVEPDALKRMLRPKWVFVCHYFKMLETALGLISTHEVFIGRDTGTQHSIIFKVFHKDRRGLRRSRRVFIRAEFFQIVRDPSDGRRRRNGQDRMQGLRPSFP